MERTGTLDAPRERGRLDLFTLSRVSPWTLLIAAGAAAGFGLRIWVLASPLGSLDSDEAITGLMARHVLDGEFSVFFWLQAYNGSQEALVTAAVFALFGSSVLGLKLVALTFYAAIAILVWRVGRRTVGERAAQLAAVLFWVWPAFLVWFSTKAYEPLSIAFGLLGVLLCLRLAERDSRLDAAALGVVLGLGWWASPERLALLAVPALVWLARRRPAAFRLSFAAAPGLLAGASPWIVWNAKNDWLSLRSSPQEGADSSFLERAGNLFEFTLPTWLGLRVPFSLDWILGPYVGWALLGAALAYLVWLIVRRPAGLGPLLLALGLFPFAYALSPFAFYVDTPRYLVAVGPVLALAFAWLLARSRVIATAGLGVAVALSISGLVLMERDRLYLGTPDERVAADLSPLLGLLEREGADRIFATYWTAYRITFESEERLIATSTGFVRYPPHDRLVRSARYPAYVFPVRSREGRRSHAQLAARGYRRVETGGFAVYLHPRGTS